MTENKYVYELGTAARDAWSTRVTARLLTGPNLFDETLTSIDAPDPAAIAAAENRARQAIAAAVGPSVPIQSPTSVGSSVVPVVSFPVPNVSLTSETTQSNFECYSEEPWTHVPLLCPFECYTQVNTTRTTVTYKTLLVTGNLTSTHIELVGQSAEETLTVPMVLSLAGLSGSSFSSGFLLTNRGTTDARVSYVFTPAFGGPGGTATDTVSAGRQKLVSDAIPYLQSLGMPLADSTGGTLRVTLSGLSSADAAGAVVRTTTEVPGGRAGLAYAGVPTSKLLTGTAYVCGLRQNEFDRSNVAVLNAGAPFDGDVTLRLTVISGDPAAPLEKTLPDVTLSPGALSQISGVLATAGLTNGTVRIERVSGTAPFYAYGVLNDQATSDGSFVAPLASSGAAPRLTLPSLVETSAYSTELVLTNLTGSPRTLRFEWVAPGLTGGRATFEVALLPHEQQILPAFVQVLRSRGVVTDPPGSAFAGALFVTDASGDLSGVFVGARVLTPGGGGRYGVFYSAVPPESEATSTAFLDGLVQNAENRTNLALVNTGAADSSADTFRIDLFDGASGQRAGSLVSTVPARGFVQIDRVLAEYAPGTAIGWTSVTRLSGSNPFVTYAVVVDGGRPGERSGDGAFVEATLPTPGRITLVESRAIP